MVEREREAGFSEDSRRFLAYLRNAMRRAGFGENKSKLATYAGTAPSTVSAWFNQGFLPSREMVPRLAKALGVSRRELLDVLGMDDEEPGADEADELPSWLTGVLEELTEAEQRVVVETARGLLQLREERATYGDPLRDAPQEPPADTPPAPPRPRRPSR